jgi:hypothetical protein
LEVGGSLFLDYSKIKSLPKGLEVGGNLNLSNSSITSLPEGLKVGSNLYLLTFKNNFITKRIGSW